MSTGALAFLLVAWTATLSLVFWSYRRLLKAPPIDEHLPPPGSIP